jgi:hypothetical protein
MANLNIPEFIEVVTKLIPPDITIRAKGKHGIGKSEVALQIAETLGLPAVVCHMAQFSEADILGLPKLDGNTTKYCKPEFLHRACVEPVVLILEELNRARPETLQVTFPLLLERKLEANNTILHPGTRIIALENDGIEYAITMFDDRAHASRFWGCHLTPTVADWLSWGSRIDPKTNQLNIHPIITDFFYITDHRHLLESADGEQIAPGEISPDRRAWARLSKTLVYCGLLNHPDSIMFRHICEGFVGVVAASTFVNYVKNIDSSITAQEILNSWVKTKVKMRFENNENDRNKYLECVMRLSKFFEDGNVLTPTQVVQVSEFMHSLPGELVLKVWQAISLKANDNTNLVEVHKLVKDLMIAVCRGKAHTNDGKIKQI